MISLFDLPKRKLDNCAVLENVEQLSKKSLFCSNNVITNNRQKLAERSVLKYQNIMGFHKKSTLTEIHSSRVISE